MSFGGKRFRAAHAAFHGALAGLALIALAGCGESNDPAKPVALDERLSGLYERNCQICHENLETGAPQTHDMAQWKPRLAQGDDLLFDHIVNGYRAMPPLGQCIECSEDDLKTLTRFMASPAPEDTK